MHDRPRGGAGEAEGELRAGAGAGAQRPGAAADRPRGASCSGGSGLRLKVLWLCAEAEPLRGGVLGDQRVTLYRPELARGLVGLRAAVVAGRQAWEGGVSS